MFLFLLILLLVFVTPIILLVFIYNRLVTLKNQAENAWHQIDVQLQRRPDLIANQNFLTLQKELSEIEANLASSRQFYNDTVLSYNNLQQTFPSNLMANMFGFKLREYFETEEAAKRAVPKVDFR